MQASHGHLPFQTPETPISGRSSLRSPLFGQALNFEPAPPVADVLRKPVYVTDLPAYQVPKDGILLRLSSLLGSLGWSPRTDQGQLLQAQSAIAIVMGSLSSRVARDLEESGWLAEREPAAGRFRIAPVTHPYGLMEAFRTLVRLTDPTVAKERRYLELVLAMMLRQYVAQINKKSLVEFKFSVEAREQFLRSARIERQLKTISDKIIRQDMLQQLHDCYYNTKSYYMFSVISREKLPDDGKLFMMYCHTAHSLARLDWDGSLLEHAHVRRLPTRAEVMFLFRRDRAAQKRCQNDPDTHTQLKALIGSFPG